MEWFPHLRQLVNITGGIKDFTIKFFSDANNNRLFTIDSHKKNITINVGSNVLDDPVKRQQALELINKAAMAEPDRPLLEVNASVEAEAIAVIESEDPLLAYFKGKIPNEDVPILKAALFIKKKYEAGESVDTYKRELRERFGRRADIIANLCSADYFSTYMKPLYKELQKRPDFTPGMFIERYNLLVTTTPFVIFINKLQSVEQFIQEAVDKIGTNRSYGVKVMNLHAIGHTNVQTLTSILDDERVAQYFVSEPSIDRQGNIMSAKIFI